MDNTNNKKEKKLFKLFKDYFYLNEELRHYRWKPDISY